MRLFDGLFAEQAAALPHDLFLPLAEGGALHAAEVFLRKGDRLGGLDAARKGDDDVFGTVPLLPVCSEILAREPVHVLRRAEDVPAVVCRAERRAGEKIEAQILGRILVHVDLFDDDALLARHLLFGEHRIEEEIGKQRERLGGVIARRLGIVAGEILPREGVHLRAEGIERVGNFERGAFFGALEEHVFDKVRNAVLAVGLERRARADEHAHGDGQEPFHALDDDAHAVFKCLGLDHSFSSLCMCNFRCFIRCFRSR